MNENVKKVADIAYDITSYAQEKGYDESDFMCALTLILGTVKSWMNSEGRLKIAIMEDKLVNDLEKFKKG
jgi:hypothetical protein